MTVGPAVSAIGLLLMIRIGTDASYMTDILPAVLVLGFAFGAGFRIALLICAGLLAMGALLAWLTIRTNVPREWLPVDLGLGEALAPQPWYVPHPGPGFELDLMPGLFPESMRGPQTVSFSESVTITGHAPVSESMPVREPLSFSESVTMPENMAVSDQIPVPVPDTVPVPITDAVPVPNPAPRPEPEPDLSIQQAVLTPQDHHCAPSPALKRCPDCGTPAA